MRALPRVRGVRQVTWVARRRRGHRRGVRRAVGRGGGALGVGWEQKRGAERDLPGGAGDGGVRRGAGDGRAAVDAPVRGDRVHRRLEVLPPRRRGGPRHVRGRRRGVRRVVPTLKLLEPRRRRRRFAPRGAVPAAVPVPVRLRARSGSGTIRRPPFVPRFARVPPRDGVRQVRGRAPLGGARRRRAHVPGVPRARDVRAGRGPRGFAGAHGQGDHGHSVDGAVRVRR
mmetsp:Transcript_9360/g.37932  ORF Transcript_9360/g.37932 Transcript_9360/m.37932 type:complete len:227 (-) Transcript_9360:2068-2748(-)